VSPYTSFFTITPFGMEVSREPPADRPARKPPRQPRSQGRTLAAARPCATGGASQPSDYGQEETSPTRPSQQQLTVILSAHVEWLASAGREGSRADLAGVDLRGLDFGRVDLTDAVLEDADLRQASLRETAGIQDPQLAGANLSRAKLPLGLLAPEALERVAETSGTCLRLYLALLFACAYVLLTTAAATDVALVSGSALASLPVLDTQIALAGFFYAAAVLLLGLYVGFHVHAQRLWEQFAELPAVFPDGGTLDQKASSGIFTDFATRRLSYLPARPLAWLRRALFRFTAWWSVPALAAVLWLRCLPRHDRSLTGFQVAIFALVVAAALAFSDLEERVRRPWGARLESGGHGYARLRTPAGRVMIALALACGLGLLSQAGISAPGSADRRVLGGDCGRRLPVYQPQYWAPRLLDAVAWGSFARMDGELIAAPWSEAEVPDEGAAWLRSIDLSGRDLRYASGRGAFFAGVDLYDADLSCAFLFRADLRRAILEQGELRGTDLIYSNLEGASLISADLRQASLDHAKLGKAKLRDADLRGASLVWADLRGADLSGAKLKGADFSNAQLAGAVFTEVTDPNCQLIAAARKQNALGVPSGNCR
jgi:uncharacterized protein YjbI with pentapeptide repeats